jgi:hypothetical protein
MRRIALEKFRSRECNSPLTLHRYDELEVVNH